MPRTAGDAEGAIVKRTAWALLSALAVGVLAVGVLRQFPTMESCRASGRVVDPTERHCVAADGYVQLREHVLFHTTQVVTLLGIAVALGSAGYWVVRRRSRPAP